MILEPTIRTVLPVRAGLSPNLGKSFENIIVSESFFFQFYFLLPVCIDFTHFNSLFIICYTIEAFKVLIFKFIVQRFYVIQSTPDGERYVTFGKILIRRKKYQFVEFERKTIFALTNCAGYFLSS